MTILRWSLLTVVLLAAAGAWLWLRWLVREGDTPFALIEDRLYVGQFVAEPPPGTGAVVNLCGSEDPYRVEAELWRPVLEGGEEPDVSWLPRSGRVHRRATAGRTNGLRPLCGRDEPQWSGRDRLSDAEAQLAPRPRPGVCAVEAVANPAQPPVDAVIERVGAGLAGPN